MAAKLKLFDSQQAPLNAQTPPNSELIPSNGMVSGETVSQWTQDWWTWVLQSPASTSAQLDTTGAYASSYQPDPNHMFFIAGTFGGDVTRELDVPAGTPLLVPVLNSIFLQFSGRGPDPLTGGKGAANMATTDWQKSVTNLFLNIDGQPVTNLQSDHIRTDWFSPGTVQPNSVADVFGFTGDLGPAKSNGYWAVLKGFAAGTTHTLDFGGSWDGTSVHIQDTIHAVPAA